MRVNVIDCHTHIGRLPGVVGEVVTPDDLCYICEHEGVHLMLASSASATTVSQQVATQETIEMFERLAYFGTENYKAGVMGAHILANALGAERMGGEEGTE